MGGGVLKSLAFPCFIALSLFPLFVVCVFLFLAFVPIFCFTCFPFSFLLLPLHLPHPFSLFLPSLFHFHLLTSFCSFCFLLLLPLFFFSASSPHSPLCSFILLHSLRSSRLPTIPLSFSFSFSLISLSISPSLLSLSRSPSSVDPLFLTLSCPSSLSYFVLCSSLPFCPIDFYEVEGRWKEGEKEMEGRRKEGEEK